MSGVSALLATLYGSGSTATGSGTSPLVSLRLAEKNRDKEIARTAKQPETQRDIAAFRKAVGKAGTIEKALSDPAVLKVLLTANGLADQLPYGALAKKVLLSDLDDPKSLVNRLGDARWKAIATSFDFANQGLSVLKDPIVQTTLADGYAEVTWRKQLEAATPGLSDALDFRERAKSFTTAIQILADPVLRRVVTTAYSIPPQIAFQELGAQEKAITTRLDIKRLQDPKFVDTLSQRYLLEKQKSVSSSGTADLVTLAQQARGLTV